MANGTLYVVSTPIGNLEDITQRAIRILREVDYIACEDTRQTSKLAAQYRIQKPLVSFYSFNQIRRIPGIIRDLEEGKQVALVSDSGSPGVSDPGFLLVREAVARNISVVPVPGPSALLAALVASGLPMDGFIFLGFLKRKAGKIRRELEAAAALSKTIIFYESPFRIRKTLALCGGIFPPDTPVVLGRELTKKFEEFIRGTLEEVTRLLEQRREIKGEFVGLIYPGIIKRGDSDEMEQGND